MGTDLFTIETQSGGKHFVAFPFERGRVVAVRKHREPFSLPEPFNLEP
jgi:hypothetical protein